VPGVKTNEVAGTRAVLRHCRMSAYKARQVLDLVRGHDVDRAEEILRTTRREAARVIEKVLSSALANARNNDQLDPDELYVSACFADEAATLKRWRPRARGRATRIRKRNCHITVIVSRLPEDRLERRRARQSEASAALRARRVAASRRRSGRAPETAEEGATPVDAVSDDAIDEVEAGEVEAGELEVDELDNESALDDTDAEVEDEIDVGAEADLDDTDAEVEEEKD
jgi:large subunit ribosomal protein L22